MENKIISYYQLLWYNLCEYIIKHNLPNNYKKWDIDAIMLYSNICHFEEYCEDNFNIKLYDLKS